MHSDFSLNNVIHNYIPGYSRIVIILFKEKSSIVAHIQRIGC